MTRLEQRDMQMEVVFGVIGRLGDGTNGLAYLEAEIPERIKDGFDERLGGGGVSRYEHQQVDVTQRAKLGAPVAARGDEADRRGGGTGLQEERVEKDVDRVGTKLGDFAAEQAGAMGGQLQLARLGEEELGPRDELSLQGGLTGQSVLQRGTAEQDGGGLVFGRHAASST